MKKVVIWGHKLHSHTHSYIHYGYFKAFESLGYDVYWFDNFDNCQDMNFDNTLFLTEGQVDQRIPLNRTSKYILHHCDNTKYVNAKCNILNLCNYVADCENCISFNYDGGIVEKVGDLCFYDKVNKALYQPWATDLLPYEINENNPIMYNSSLNTINYVGTITHDNIRSKFVKFCQTANSCGKQVKVFQKVGFKDNEKFVKDSYISVDIRGDWHLQCGYIPCRLWKNLSYGKLTGTNSKFNAQILGEHVVLDANPSTLYFTTETAYTNLTKNKMRNTMLFVKENHTYINRIKNILEIWSV